MSTNPALAPYLIAERGGFRWFHVEEVHGPALDVLAAEFGLHELAIEDCRNLRQRSKLEEYESHLFLIVNTIHFDAEKTECWFGELDFFVGKDFLISVHDGPSRTFRAVKPKFDTDPKMAHPGKLLYAMLDYVADQYLPVLDSIQERIEVLEERSYEEPSPQLLAEIFSTKRALIDFRRIATGMRELVGHLLHRSEPWLRTQQAYFRNVYDHVVRAMDFMEAYRDILTGVLDVHLTATANRTNDIMKVLTIYATLAIPFLLVTGYYGMNFENLPLLHHPDGFLWVTSGMGLIALVLLWFFKRRGWF
jgi:magnesium transporter